MNTKTDRASILFVTFLHFLNLLLLLINSGSQQREDDARLRVDADGGHQHLPGTFHHVRTGKYHRIERFPLLNMI